MQNEAHSVSLNTGEVLVNHCLQKNITVGIQLLAKAPIVRGKCLGKQVNSIYRGRAYN